MEPMTEHISVEFDVHSRETLRAAQKRFRAIDVHAADLPEDKEAYEAMLKPALKVPRMSTFANGAIIARTVQEMAPGTSYVNVGIWNGFSFFAGMVAGPDRPVVGIDNFSQFGGPKDQAMEVFERLKGRSTASMTWITATISAMSTRARSAFTSTTGEHSYDNQLQGLKVAEPYFSKRLHRARRRHQLGRATPGNPGFYCPERPTATACCSMKKRPGTGTRPTGTG